MDHNATYPLLVFAYPFHFGKSGFSAYFFHAKSGYPDFIRIFCAGPYILFSNCDTGDVGLLMKIKMQ